MKVEERFWSKVDKSAGCWVWTACVDTSGYGLFRVAGRLWKAHRYALTLAGIELKPELVILHSCDNTRCVNPLHMSQGTRADNNADRDTKGRHVPLLGEGHGMHKLTDDGVRAIRAARSAGAPLKELASIYGVHPSTVHRAATGRQWAHV